MKVQRPRLADYLQHIIDAIERIGSYTKGMDEHSFTDDALVQDAVIRNIEVLGEAARRIRASYPEFADLHPEIPFDAAYQMRNAVSHGYFSIDLGTVWETIVTDLPALAASVRGAARTIE